MCNLYHMINFQGQLTRMLMTRDAKFPIFCFLERVHLVYGYSRFNMMLHGFFHIDLVDYVMDGPYVDTLHVAADIIDQVLRAVLLLLCL